jgi:hypothetical protein
MTSRKCSCGCNRLVSRTTEWRHGHNGTAPPSLRVQHESPLPPKRRRIAHSQVGQEPFIIRSGKQKQSHADNGSHSRADANSSSHAPSFEFNSSLPLLDPPPASNLLQSTGDAHTESSVLIIDDILRNLHVRTHRTTDRNDDEDFEDALEGDTVEGADSDHETDGSWNGEDVTMDCDVDPREGIVSDWDLLAEEFIVEAEELGEFDPSLLHTL